jgi:hypothetical protein
VLMGAGRLGGIPVAEPPDVMVTDIFDHKLGIEPTEWLDKRQTTPSISATERWSRGVAQEFRWGLSVDRLFRLPVPH